MMVMLGFLIGSASPLVTGALRGASSLSVILAYTSVLYVVGAVALFLVGRARSVTDARRS
jgi:hypothetical protein